MGCTEPIAVAWAGALARRTLGALPDRVELTVSGNIIKNVKSVIVPHTGGRKGLRVAVAAGICYGDADRELEALSDATEEQQRELDGYLDRTEIEVLTSDARCPFDLRVGVWAGADEAYVRIIGHHTNVVQVRRNGEMLVDEPFADETVQAPEDRALLTVEGIVDFADTVALEDVREALTAEVLEAARDEAYASQTDEWVSEENPNYYPERMQ